MRKLAAVVLLSICIISCGKQRDVVPYVRVNRIIQKSDIRFSEGTGVIFENGIGVAGIIVYRRPDGNYVAYDQCSSYQPEKLCKVVLDNTGLQVEDPCSGSKFLLFDGSVVKGPAERMLRQYTVVETQYEIQITN
ncbi:hypothetical protein DJ568_06545 [Mucilaginibacter hurinus]|uniref:Rieske domain-containing protein n=1 Tax=Mucilaginibacter hurinus TaxID=2201324 RepID=A0A367GR42_9SPHI|nr:hypothetical protein [Mucilaginibacter hurinus]RCH55545.1 hypothetical protein DJ568_06545 [Mucilaginibacter hurinus]